MPKQVFKLTAANEKEEKSSRWLEESGLYDHFKKLNDQRCGCALGDPPLSGGFENIRAFFVRLGR